MTNSNSCIVIVNNILREYIDDFPYYLSQGFEKLSEILPSIIPTIKNSNIDWSNQQNKINFTDEETNTILHILIQPTYKDLKDTIKILTDQENIKERFIVYIGSHSASYSSNWLLEDGIFSANSMLTTLSKTSWIENNSMESSSINILTPGNSAHWNKILSTLKLKETKQDRVRVFSFSSEIKIGEESTLNKDIEEFCQTLYQKYQPILLNDDIINSSQNIGTLQLMNKNGSFYVFDEGCGQSSLLALNGFNLLIDGGYKRAPEFWNFLQKLEKIDTYMMTSWNETNLFGMESLLDFKSKSAENSGDLSRPNLNYCVLPIGPNPLKETEKLEIKSHLEINIEMESQRILHQIKSLEIPLLQMSRDAKSMLSPHQLYFKLGQGCLDVFPLWPCSADTSGDSKRYVDEWQKESKLQTIYFDELVKDNASAFLLIWNGSKVTVESQTEEANMLTRILISSSCHESNLFKSLEEFSKVNSICNSFSGKPTEKKAVEKIPISADPNKKSTVPAKESSKSMTDKANAAKKLLNSNDKSKEINKSDVQNKLTEKKLQPSADKSSKLKSNDKKDEKKDDIVGSKLSDEKVKNVEKKAPLSKASPSSQPTKKLNDKIVDSSDSKKPVKKSSPTDKVLETNEAKKPIKKLLTNDKTPEIDDTKKNAKKSLTTEKVTEAGDGKKPLKKPTVSDKLAESIDTKKSVKKTAVSDKSTDSAEVKKLTKKPLSNEKSIETHDSKKSKKTLPTDKGSEADAKKPIKKTVPNEKTVEIANGKKTEKKPTKDETVDQKKLPKRPTSEKLSEKPVVNKKSATVKSEIETKKSKDSKFLPQHKTAKKADAKCPDIKKDDKNIADVTVIKNDLESDLEKIEVVGQPSISLNTDDTLNNIDTSELLGKMEVIGPNSNHVEDEQLLITAERYDLQSTPLSDMITDSPEHPKTEEDVEALKTDALSIDQDLLINNEEFPEDEKITEPVNEELIEREIKAQEEIEHTNISDEIPVVGEINDSDSKDLHQEFVLESQNLKDYGIYEDGEYDDEHKIEAGEDLQENHEDTSGNFEFVKEFEIESHDQKEPFESESQQVEGTELSLDLHHIESEKEKETDKINDFDDLQDLDPNIDNIVTDKKSENQEDLTTKNENEMMIDESQEMNFHLNSNFDALDDKKQNDMENDEVKSQLYEYEMENENKYESKQEIEEIKKEISFEKESHLEDILNTDSDSIDKNIGQISQNIGDDDAQDDKQISEIEEYDKKQTFDDDLNINNQVLGIDDNMCYVEENVMDKKEINYLEKENFLQFDVLHETNNSSEKTENISDNIEYDRECDNRIEDPHVSDHKLDFKTHATEIIEDISHEEQVQKCEDFPDEKYDLNKDDDVKSDEDETRDFRDESKFETEINKKEMITESDKKYFDEQSDLQESEPQDWENVENHYPKKELYDDINDTIDFQVEKIYDLEEKHEFKTTEDEKDLIDNPEYLVNYPENEIEENPFSKEEQEDSEDICQENDIIAENSVPEHNANYLEKGLEEYHNFEKECDPQLSNDVEDAYHEKGLIDQTINPEHVVDYLKKEIDENQDFEKEHQTSEEMEDAHHEKYVIDETYITEKEIEENQNYEERLPQGSEDIEADDKDVVDEAINPRHEVDYFEKEIDENKDSEEYEHQASEDIEDVYHEKDVIDETHLHGQEIEENQYSEEERKHSASEDIEDAIDQRHIPEKEIDENQDSEEERERQASENIEDVNQEKGVIDETHLHGQEIEENQDSEEEREHSASEDIEDAIDQTHVPEKEIDENQDSEEERERQASENIEDVYHEKDVIDETHLHNQEIEENQDSEEEREHSGSEDIEDAIDQTHVPEKEIDKNQDSEEERERQASENIEDVYHEKDIIDETHIPGQEIKEDQDSEEERESQASENIEDAYQEKDVIGETHTPEKEIEENQIFEEREPQDSEDIDDTRHEKYIIEENSVSEHIEDYTEKEMTKTHDIDYHDNIKADDESHEKLENFREVQDQGLNSENAFETTTIESIKSKNVDIQNDDAYIHRQNEEEPSKQSEYDVENQCEIPDIENMHHDKDLYSEDVYATKEFQNETKYIHDQDISNDYNMELSEKEMIDSYPQPTIEHKEVFEDISETNIRKEESEYHPYQDDSMNLADTYKSKNFEDDEENDDGEMIIHDVASVGEMDHINESDENEDLSENPHESENTSEVENNQNQEHFDELENENEYKHIIDGKSDCGFKEDQQMENSVNDKIREHDSNEDVIEDRNIDPDSFDNDFDAPKENFNSYNYEEENTQEMNDNNEFNLPEKCNSDNEENDLSNEANLDHHNLTERPDSLLMGNYPINEDLTQVQVDSVSSENHPETDRIMPDSESNDSDLSVDIVKDHTADSSKDSEQETYVPSMPVVLDDIIEDTSPSSLVNECSEFNRSEFEPTKYNINEVDNSQMNMTDVNITPDILRGLKHLNLSEPTEVEVEQIVEDEEIIKYQTSIHDSDQILKSDITDQFLKDSSEISDKESKESDESIHIPSPTDDDNDDRINMSCKPDHDNLIGSVNGNHHYEHFHESDSNHATQWNEPLGLPMPTLLSSKPSTKPASEKVSSHPSTKLKSANTTTVKLNGTSSNAVSAVTHKSADSAKGASSPRNSIPPKPSAPKSAPISKAPASKSAKKPEIVDPSKSPAFYMEIAYIPVDHDGNVNPNRVSEAFFTRVRARQYILPGLEHSSEVLDMILAARNKWSQEENDIEVRLTPIKMTETLKNWAHQHAQELSKLNIKIGAAVEHCSVSLGDDNNMPCIAHRIDF